ncbi:hypothetical protein BLA29_014644 [Euroglyphus maynei]|uniref:Uncharacterized protein n=1 Tax=Euroglyphus maynei TaxID=6958 RepID=A0A1Y3BRN2_EURMA|nr:hypothetical protein BLA29_014644 [Euroglyphus maynei]
MFSYRLALVFCIIKIVLANEQIILHAVKKNDLNMIGFPYKSIYGIPDHLNCTDNVRNEFNKCENEASKTWSINVENYVRFHLLNDFNFF